jgi:thioester reductase-like protein
MSCYFLTGGTGVVGSRVLEHLLDSPANRVYMLVRAESDDAAAQRVRHLLQRTIGSSDDRHLDRIVVVRGDASQPRFGIGEAQYHQLLADCRRIVHSAGLVRMNLPLEQARASAVGAAEQVVGLARTLHDSGRLEKVEFVSTVGVGGRMTEVPEEWIEQPRGFHNTYEQAKAEAETLVHAGVSEGLPITVHRPSMVVGDSQTGRIASFQVFYHLCEFLSGLRSWGIMPPFGDARLDTVPVDYVASGIVWSSGEPKAIGKIMHFCSGLTAIPLVDLRRLVIGRFNAFGIRTPTPRTIPTQLFSALLAVFGFISPPNVRRAIRTAPLFLNYLASRQTFLNPATSRLLARQILTLPAPSVYLTAVLDYYRARRHA